MNTVIPSPFLLLLQMFLSSCFFEGEPELQQLALFIYSTQLKYAVEQKTKKIKIK